MIIDNLASLPSTITTGDELPVERGTTTYKIDYNALASAILAHALPNDVIISCGTGYVESGQNGYISTGSAKHCILFIQRNPNGGAMYGVDGDVLTPYITVSGVAVDLPNNTEVRILNQGTGRTLTWFVIRLGAAS